MIARTDDMAFVKQVKDKFEAVLMSKPHVVGVGIGLTPVVTPQQPRKLALIVSVSEKPTQEEEDGMPKVLEGVPVVVQETGRLRAL